MFTCNICGVNLRRKASHKRHLMRRHQINIVHEENTYRNRCLDCKVSFPLRKALREHLKDKHGLQPDLEVIQFSSKAELDDWLDNLPITKHAEYVKIKKDAKIGENGLEVTYYECNRSSLAGSHSLKVEERKRQLKSTGCKKMSFNCTSQIIVTKKSSEEYSVQYYQTHYGHALEIKHLNLPKPIRREVEVQLINRVPPTSILDFYRDSASEQVNRGDFITLQDIKNIASASNIPMINGVRHTNDVVSVDMWVEECKSKGEDNPILLYKKQGDEHESLQCKDFIIIIMTGQQKKMIQKFGRGIIAIDSTHGLNSYDFLMSALLVVDEFGEGFPVGYMFSNREDTYIFELFFRIVKEKVGIISPQTFMTDITHVFYNAWKNVMGPVENQLYCSWHVDKAFQQNLKKIRNVTKRASVYQTLKVVQRIGDVEKFTKSFQTFLQELEEDDDTRDFYYYLNCYYSQNVNKWAYCYRKGCGINTNMRVENVFKNLKHNYLQGRKVGRLDKGIDALMRLTRDKFLSRERRSHMGRINSHTKKVSERHSKALSESMIIQVENEQYLVNNKYRVTPRENHACVLTKCVPCNICVSCYTCTCEDYCHKFTICCHMHAVAIEKQKNESTESNQNEGNRNISYCEGSRLSRPSADNLNKKAELYMNKLNAEMSLAMETLSDMDAKNKLDCVMQLYNSVRSLNARMSIIKKAQVSEAQGVKPDREGEKNNDHGATHYQPLPPIIFDKVDNNVNQTSFVQPLIMKQSSEPGNKKITQQIRFCSTKKKTIAKRKIRKPNRSEAAAIIEILNEKRFFISTSSKNDHAYAVSSFTGECKDVDKDIKNCIEMEVDSEGSGPGPPTQP